MVRAQRGDARAKNELVRHNVALVVMIARKQSRGTIRLEELVQGVPRAPARDREVRPAAGTRFSTYAVWSICAFVWKYLKQARPRCVRGAARSRRRFSLDASVGEDGDVSYLDRLRTRGRASRGVRGPRGGRRAGPRGARQGQEAPRRARLGHRPHAAEAGSTRHARADRQPLGRIARARAPGGAPDEALPAGLPRPDA